MEQNMSENTIILSTTYTGSIAYWHRLVHAQDVYIDAHEHYQKQTTRNRCYIAGANGLLMLSVPVEKTSQMPVNNVRIVPNDNWKIRHWRSLCTAYNHSPYFLFYRDAFEDFYLHTHHTNLYENNFTLLKIIARCLKWKGKLLKTDCFIPIEESNKKNIFRTPVGERSNEMKLKTSYPQVFPVQENMLGACSLLDLLFNTGPDALTWLQTKA